MTRRFAAHPRESERHVSAREAHHSRSKADRTPREACLSGKDRGRSRSLALLFVNQAPPHRRELDPRARDPHSWRTRALPSASLAHLSRREGDVSPRVAYFEAPDLDPERRKAPSHAREAHVSAREVDPTAREAHISATEAHPWADQALLSARRVPGSRPPMPMSAREPCPWRRCLPSKRRCTPSCAPWADGASRHVPCRPALAILPPGDVPIEPEKVPSRAREGCCARRCLPDWHIPWPDESDGASTSSCWRPSERCR